jgi:hypothetical protein
MLYHQEDQGVEWEALREQIYVDPHFFHDSVFANSPTS